MTTLLELNEQVMLKRLNAWALLPSKRCPDCCVSSPMLYIGDEKYVCYECKQEWYLHGDTWEQ
jgi:hypothetical protein